LPSSFIFLTCFFLSLQNEQAFEERKRGGREGEMKEFAAEMIFFFSTLLAL